MGIANWLQMPLMSGNIWRYQELELFWQIKLIKIFVPNYQLEFSWWTKMLNPLASTKTLRLSFDGLGTFVPAHEECQSLVEWGTWDWFFNRMESAHFSMFQKPEYSSFCPLVPVTLIYWFMSSTILISSLQMGPIATKETSPGAH